MAGPEEPTPASVTYLPELSSDQKQYCKDALHTLENNSKSNVDLKIEFDTLEKVSMTESSVATDKEKLCKVAIRDNNKEKNRYPNVLPFDDNRVVLRDSAKDYINASFVGSFTEGVAQFIATQGPLPDTSEDFWEMVLQYECPVIIMLTEVIENKVVKCHNYFQSDNGPIEFGNISIAIRREESAKGLAIRHLEVTNAKSRVQPFSVLHYQYLEWPDHGAPEDVLAVGEIVRRTCLLHTKGPILVHCSAGIGRTGTYCTIHATIQKILRGDNSALNFAETVKEFRIQRAGMVQSLKQYEFCHKAVIDVLKKFTAEGNNP